MSRSVLVLFGGWMSMLGGAFLAAAYVVDYAAGGVDTVLGKGILFVAHVLLLFSFIGLHEAQGKPSHRVDLMGKLLGIVGTILVGGIALVELVAAAGADVDQVLASQVGSFVQSIGPLLFIAGSVFVGRSILKNRILSKRGGRLLIIGAILFAIGTIAERDMASYVLVLGAAFTGVGFGLTGYSVKGSIADKK